MLVKTTAAVVAATLALIACGGDDDSATVTTSTVAGTTTPAVSTTAVDTTPSASRTVVGTTASGQLTELEQPAIWPAADVVFASPEEAAEDFVRQVLGVPPTLGEFRQGDARSGEIEVLSPGEVAGAAAVPRGLLLLRQLGADDGWFIVAAVNDNASIAAPESIAEVAAGPVTVAGRARGFESTVVVTAFVPGDADDQLDQVITVGGSFETPEPFTVVLDLSAASAGDVVALLVRGDTGLETDPGDFGAIPVVIGGLVTTE